MRFLNIKYIAIMMILTCICCIGFGYAIRSFLNKTDKNEEKPPIIKEPVNYLADYTVNDKVEFVIANNKCTANKEDYRIKYSCLTEEDDSTSEIIVYTDILEDKINNFRIIGEDNSFTLYILSGNTIYSSYSKYDEDDEDELDYYDILLGKKRLQKTNISNVKELGIYNEKLYAKDHSDVENEVNLSNVVLSKIEYNVKLYKNTSSKDEYSRLSLYSNNQFEIVTNEDASPSIYIGSYTKTETELTLNFNMVFYGNGISEYNEKTITFTINDNKLTEKNSVLKLSDNTDFEPNDYIYGIVCPTCG